VNCSAAVVVKSGHNAMVVDAKQICQGESAGKIYGGEIPVVQQKAML